ncbi:DUF742 domain-containing protein [Amycolatopsis acidicola]|uniref:DUF742 domain-containing protein n=1 Tax=Amycolatopsis acidicola TaxID=2596893 RepID=A0A5N0ULY3_9PSEU|nr:DUF742 domain-containing protein [Amycolatopsis acidicola]KAA9150318.1 DUF742 domain-containing protein [Amycolatopsis acidicola]
MSEDDYEDHPVRPYVMTAGRAHPSRNTVRPETLFLADPGARLPLTAGSQQRALVSLCRGVLSLAELAAHLGLPVSLVAVLVSDLVDTGNLVVRSAPGRARPDRDALEKVLDALRNL